MSFHASAARSATLGFVLVILGAPLGALAQEPPPSLEARPAMLDFGIIERSTGFQGYITVRNTSDHSVALGRFSTSVPIGLALWVDDGCAGGTLDPGDTCSIDVEGYVRADGVYTATLSLHSDDPRSPLVMQVRAGLDLPRTPPVMSGPPVNRAMLRAFLPPKHAARFMWAWSATEDENLSGFTAQMRAGRSDWKTVVRPSRPTQSNNQWAPVTVPTGKEVALRVRPHDEDGVGARWVSRTVRISYRDIRPGGTLEGEWKSVAAPRTAYDDDVVVTRGSGATASITVKARGLALLGRRGPQQGGLEVLSNRDRIGLWAKQNTDLQVLYTWQWDKAVLRTVTVQPFAHPYQKLTLDAWVILQ